MCNSRFEGGVADFKTLLRRISREEAIEVKRTLLHTPPDKLTLSSTTSPLTGFRVTECHRGEEDGVEVRTDFWPIENLPECLSTGSISRVANKLKLTRRHSILTSPSHLLDWLKSAQENLPCQDLVSGVSFPPSYVRLADWGSIQCGWCHLVAVKKNAFWGNSAAMVNSADKGKLECLFCKKCNDCGKPTF
jgi:hypothetical protein